MNELLVALHNLSTTSLKSGTGAFFAALGYASQKTEELPSPDAAGFARAFGHAFSKTALQDEWKRVELLFQLTGDEIGGQLSLGGDGFDRQRFESFLFFAVELKGDAYSRGALAGIARELNKPFPMPVIVLFRHGATVSLASLHRRENKKDSNRDVLDRVVLLKDIRLENPHRAHLEILGELAGAKSRARDWAGFLAEWNRVLDISQLNKKFYRELSNWFFAAREHVSFPDKGENATERGLIRLITRLIFTWFIKERDLVPDALFEQGQIEKLLVDSSPQSESYYRAVLQNLFFATLNTEMGERRFRRENGGAHGQSGDYGLSCFFRYEKEFKAPQKWLDLVEDVPFLNGGLFECLDPEDKDGARIDGFSDVASRQARIPNKLFWGDKWRADLSNVYDDKKQKSVEVTPILNLLHSYKFTIDENTPLEEDVALDPELLGKVFENLLASYNPETRTTARKQTGSFYTPREIVGYMVEEALAAYLENAVLPEKSTPEFRRTFQESLRLLLSETDARPAQDIGFSGAQIERLVEALQSCTILDPACGSGAFPMGALAKMVALLRKLDPKNALWLDSQLRAVDRALEATGAERSVIEDAKQRVREAFALNDRDYARKLYLIERCLFGVDIQPVALQIAKLRFFIALIIDQKIDRTRPNFNIRALPNLETKFVAANTLIGLPTSGAITPVDLPPLETQLAEVRRRHIAPKSRTEKKRLEHEDTRLRSQIETLMHEAGFGDSFITPIVGWNPYDQNAVAPFFEPERMFGPELKDGFDVVIGNPPYGAEIDSMMTELRPFYADVIQNYAEIYKMFFKRGLEVLKKGGMAIFITPNTFIAQPRYKDLRKFILKYEMCQILNLGENVFEQVVVPVSISVIKNSAQTGSYLFADLSQQSSFSGEFLNIDFQNVSVKSVLSSKDLSLYFSVPLPDGQLYFDQVLEIKDAGIQYHRSGIGLKNKGGNDLYERLFSEDSTTFPHSHPVWYGRLMDRYYIRTTTDEFFNLDYKKVLAKNETASFNRQAFDTCPKIIWRQTASILRATIDFESRWFRNTIQCAFIKDEFQDKVDIKFALGVINSKYLAFLYNKLVNEAGRAFPQIKLTHVKKLPFVMAAMEEQAAIAAKVEAILAAKAADSAADVSRLEREIDELVAQLYGLDDAEKTLVGIG